MKTLFSRFSKLYLLLFCILWIAVITGMLYFVPAGISPVSSVSTVNSAHPGEVILAPGDVLTQEFTIPEGSLDSLSLVLDYDPEQAADSQVLISVLQKDTVVMEQQLPLSAVAPSCFFSLAIREDVPSKDPYTFRIENISEDPSGCFSVPYTDTPNLNTSGFSNLSVNAVPQSGKALCSVEYTTGYTIYTACCIAFCFLLGGIILSALLLRLTSHRQ